LSILVLNERITRAELAATIVSFLGAVILTAGDLNLSMDHFIGDLLCLASMLAIAVYVVLARRNRNVPSLWLYIVPIYALGGLACLAISMLYVSPFQHYPPREIIAILGLGTIPTVLGHS